MEKTLVDRIRADSIEARKAQEDVRSNLLVTLLSDIVKVGKDNGNRATTDEEAMAVVRKFLKNASETREVVLSQLREKNKMPHIITGILNGDNPEYVRQTNPLFTEELPRLMNNRAALEVEIQILNSYLPKQLSEAELRDVIKSFGTNNLGEIMKRLKDAYAGQYDGKMASNIAKGL